MVINSSIITTIILYILFFFVLDERRLLADTIYNLDCSNKTKQRYIINRYNIIIIYYAYLFKLINHFETLYVFMHYLFLNYDIYASINYLVGRAISIIMTCVLSMPKSFCVYC